MFLAHGGTPGLIAELSPLALVLIVGVAVWWKSRSEEDSDAAWAGDEPPVQEERGDGE